VAPAAILLGVLYSLTKMSRANEIVAMLGAGRSIAQILQPIFLTALAASFISLAANYYWAPRAEGNRQAIMRALTEGESGSIMAEALLFHNVDTGRTWYAGSFPFDLRDEKIRNIEVRQLDAQGRPERAWIARSAMWWPGDRKWRFYQGQEIEYANGKPVALKDFTGRLPGSASKIDVSGIEETPWSIVSSALIPDFMGVPDLVSYLKGNPESSTAALAPFRTHLHHRFAFPFQCFVLALVAAPLGIAYSRRGSLGGIAASIFIFFGMIFVNDLFLSLGKGGHLPPPLAVWIPNAGFGLVGLLLLYLRSQNKELPKLKLKPAKIARPRNRNPAPSPA
jgi:lipopolysaccharide export LptBFGC system permease protein LptF